MTADICRVQRRMLLGMAAAAVSVAAAPAWAETALVGPDDDPTLIVAGPADSDAAAWARLMLPSLTAGLMEGATLDMRCTGGQDGVTAGNQFDARAMPDGSQALLFQGGMALPWMAGDSRVRFDMGHFLPLLALASPGVVMMRGGLGVPTRPGPVRLICGTAPEPAQTALMALDLLEIAAVPVATSQDAPGAVRAGAADAVFVHGKDVAGHARGLIEAGLLPAFTTSLKLSQPDLPSGHPLSGVPHLLRLLPPAQIGGDPGVTAWRAVAAASSLALVLALPRLSAASSVARWRRACRASLASGGVAEEVDGAGLQLLPDSETAVAMQMIRADAAAQITFRRWLGDRLSWRPA